MVVLAMVVLVISRKQTKSSAENNSEIAYLPGF